MKKLNLQNFKKNTFCATLLLYILTRLLSNLDLQVIKCCEPYLYFNYAHQTNIKSHFTLQLYCSFTCYEKKSKAKKYEKKVFKKSKEQKY